MVTEATLERIEDSLTQDEQVEDFAMLIDLLTEQRRLFHPSLDEATVERVSGIIVCLREPVKPDPYIETMAAFRRLFQGVSDSRGMQVLFTASIFPAALVVASIEDIVFKPSTYFNPVMALIARGIELDGKALDGHFDNFFIDHGRVTPVERGL